MSTFLKSCRRLLSDMPSRLSAAGITSNDSCESCHVNFNIIRKKRPCSKCHRCFCTDCLVSRREATCRSCAVLSSWQVQRPQLLQLKARDIKAYLTANGVSTHGCVEKEELVELALCYLGSRQQQVPVHNSRRFSTRIVDDAWVFVNNSSTSRGPTSSQVPNSSGNTSPNQVPNPNSNIPTSPVSSSTTTSNASTSQVSSPSGNTSRSQMSSPSGHRSPSEMPNSPSTTSPTHVASLSGNTSPNQAPNSPGHNSPEQTPCIQVPNSPGNSMTNPIPDIEISIPSTSINIPMTERTINDNLSSSLPPISMLDDNMASERILPKGPSLSESQPNLLSEPATTSQEASGSGEQSQRTNSQHSVDNMSILAMSRTDLAALTDADLEKLSIKNLKVLLTKHRVDFRGCCEKEELLDRTRRLQEQMKVQAAVDVTQLSDENLCKVCMAAVIDCVLLDCGHLVTCTPCGKQMNECPICRQYVVRVVKTFRA